MASRKDIRLPVVGDKILTHGVRGTVTGLPTRKGKRSIIVTSSDGETLIISEDVLLDSVQYGSTWDDMYG